MRQMALLVAALLLMGIAGCRSCPKRCGADRPVIEAQRTAVPVTVDGRLDECVWKKARAYPMAMSMDKIAKNGVLREPGLVRLAWDKDYLYVAFELTDSDVVAEGTKDNLHHYNLGDVGEVFLKPQGYSWYWELYVTPAGRMSTFWFPGRGRLGLPSCFDDYHFDLKVAAQCRGTLNKWQDKDIGWTAEMAVPVSQLTARGEQFGPGSRWYILVGRYNYSRYLPYIGPEYSMLPQLSETNYHLLEEYGILQFAE